VLSDAPPPSRGTSDAPAGPSRCRATRPLRLIPPLGKMRAVCFPEQRRSASGQDRADLGGVLLALRISACQLDLFRAVHAQVQLHGAGDLR